MSEDQSHEHQLPENVRDWPIDPTSLLGVKSDVSRRDLKRAYTRLIKQYKPEHAPEEFRRLREAYESLSSEVEWREVYELRRSELQRDQEEQPGEPQFIPTQNKPDDDTNDERPLASEQDESEPLLLAPPRNRSDRVTTDQLWQQALDGRDLTQVYRGLVDFTRQAIPSEIDYARLYWLLTLVSDLDEDRDPSDWLLAGISRYPTSSRLFAILETEVRRRNGAIPAIFEDQLLDERLPVGKLVDLVDLRWYAARRQSKLAVIGGDFELLKKRFLDEPEEWLRLLSVGLQHVVLTHAVGFINQFREAMGQATSSAANTWLWDLIETNVALHNAWLQVPDLLKRQPVGMPPILKDIVELIEVTWELSVSESKIPVQKFSQMMTVAPKQRYRELFEIAQTSRPIMRRLRELIDQQLGAQGHYAYSEVTPGLDDELQRFVRKRFVEGNSISFNSVTLEFCLQQAVTPYDIAATLQRMGQTVPDEYFEIAEQLTNNIALQCVIQANRLLW